MTHKVLGSLKRALLLPNQLTIHKFYEKFNAIVSIVVLSFYRQREEEKLHNIVFVKSVAINLLQKKRIKEFIFIETL